MYNEKLKHIAERLEDGSINGQSVWRYIKERNTALPSQLCRTAVIDCTREYTYGQMFTEWEHYARVFSALGITSENGSRAGIGGTISAEPLFAFYGLNMTGVTVSMMSYPDFLPGGQWKAMIKREKITDLIISDTMITPVMWPEFEEAKEELGLRNIILLHSKLGGPCAGPAELVYNEINHHALKRLSGTVFMDDLLKQHAAAPISFGSEDPGRIAMITHTSGTTKGTRKPLPYTQRAMNTLCTVGANVFHDFAGKDSIRLAPSFDFSSFLCMTGIINNTLASGDTVVLTFFGFMHPKFIRAVGYYDLDALFTSGFMVDRWMERGDLGDVDFSGLRIFSCGGSYVPTEKLKKYTAFVRSHGFSGGITRGYGMSESGGSQILTQSDEDADIVGFPDPVEDFLILDEDDGKYYTAADGVRTGILYMTSDSMCLNELDGEKLFDLTEIKGREFICTNDMMRVNADGSLSYAGRADRYFINNDGVRFDPGLVETAVSRQPQIDKCAVVPVLDKRIHDTVPVLYVIPSEPGEGSADSVADALKRVFLPGKECDQAPPDGTDVAAAKGGIAGKAAAKRGITAANLPSQFVIVDNIPCNANGKIDIYRITRDRLHGEAYDIMPVRAEDGRMTDIKAVKVDQVSSIKAGTLPEGMEGRSALGIYDIFNR